MGNSHLPVIPIFVPRAAEHPLHRHIDLSNCPVRFLDAPSFPGRALQPPDRQLAPDGLVDANITKTVRGQEHVRRPVPLASAPSTNPPTPLPSLTLTQHSTLPSVTVQPPPVASQQNQSPGDLIRHKPTLCRHHRFHRKLCGPNSGLIGLVFKSNA